MTKIRMECFHRNADLEKNRFFIECKQAYLEYM